MTAQQLAVFGSHFGELHTHALPYVRHPEQPNVTVVCNEPPGLNIMRATGQPVDWHADGFFKRQPQLASILKAVILPEDPNIGQTLFACLYTSYDALDDTSKAKLEGKRQFATFNKVSDTIGMKAAEDRRESLNKGVDHLVVRTHPETGKKCIFVNELFSVRIEGMGAAESHALLKILFAHSTKPDFIYAHKWLPGDMLLFDNRCLIHTATPCSTLRKLWRCDIGNSEVF